jgi:hypothetical protein
MLFECDYNKDLLFSILTVLCSYYNLLLGNSILIGLCFISKYFIYKSILYFFFSFFSRPFCKILFECF